ncbi:MAG: hypothetical protein J2P18_22820 [Nocardia sp.]|nr:hypothetical protein [Nocardia sp.]
MSTMRHGSALTAIRRIAVGILVAAAGVVGALSAGLAAEAHAETGVAQDISPLQARIAAPVSAVLFWPDSTDRWAS